MSFSKFARFSTNVVASSFTFGAACSLTAIWLFLGPFFGFSDTWQLVCNTVSTVVTTLIVILLQNSQNEDTQRITKKLEEVSAQLRDLEVSMRSHSKKIEEQVAKRGRESLGLHTLAPF